jgi:hypothetical protein
MLLVEEAGKIEGVLQGRIWLLGSLLFKGIFTDGLSAKS